MKTMSSKSQNVALKEVPVNAIKPNPYRNIDEYPLRPEKLDALEASINETGFWDNIVCRPKGKGYEIAYGHHRLEVLSTILKQKKAQVLIKELSNEQMLKMMSYENHEAFGSDAWVEMEDIRQTIGAYGHGEIELPGEIKPSNRAKKLYPQGAADRAYTKMQIARFLGRMHRPVQRFSE